MNTISLSGVTPIFPVSPKVLREFGPDLPVPLTVDYLLGTTYTVQFRDLKARYANNMFWYEDSNHLTLESKVGFINRVLERIKEMLLFRELPITLISHGAPGFLTEYYIHRYLIQFGFTDVRWRFIDTVRQPLPVREDFRAFREKALAPTALLLADADYFGMSPPGNIQAGEDRLAGATIILSFHGALPGLVKQPDLEQTQASGGLLLRGRYSRHDHETNSICVFFGDMEELASYIDYIRNPRLTENAVCFRTAAKFTVWSNRFQIACSENENGHLLYNRLRDVMEKRHAQPENISAAVPGTDLSPMIDDIVEAIKSLTLSSRTPLYFRYFRFMDYDIYLTRLRAFFRDGTSPCLFASLINDGITLE
ncbi:hypothetical protein [Martelella alba]|uniref:Uncharacterized protein n=1 Tax=Martelella alba TaxID=2590451 RepID=A0ABY2SIR0_9HYPH|nr:hypothetical protein [Martelella alba]TKI05118.1 hypothetical protein FCN80_15570 [Martelella alba]